MVCGYVASTRPYSLFTTCAASKAPFTPSTRSFGGSWFPHENESEQCKSDRKSFPPCCHFCSAWRSCYACVCHGGYCSKLVLFVNTSQDGDTLVVDPSSKEEAACSASATVVINAHGEVCLLHKSGGLGLSLSQVGYIWVHCAVSPFL